MKYEVTAGSQTFKIEIDSHDRLTVDGEELAYDFQVSRDPNLFSIILANRSYELRATAEGEGYRVFLRGDSIEVKVEDERQRRLAKAQQAMGGAAGEILVKAPMPGLIIDVLVEAGQEVAGEETLVILESMKMHNEFKAPRDCVIKEARVKTGDKVSQNDVMLILE